MSRLFSADKCMWSDCNRICVTLHKAGVPLDDKWPLLILFLRSVGTASLMSEMQKTAMQELLLTLLQKKDFTDSHYHESMQTVHSILNKPYQQKLHEVVREAGALAKEVSSLLGDQKQQVLTVSGQVEADIAHGVEPTAILSSIRSSLKDLVTKMELDTQKLTELSHKDSLTGLANRRSLDAFLEESIDLWQKKSVPASLIMFDVDHFKKCNDNYGHLVGDQVLQFIAYQLRKVCAYSNGLSTQTLAARYGGEEFVMVVRGPQAETASFIAEQLRLLMCSVPLRPKGLDGKPVDKAFCITISLGISQLWQGWVGAYHSNLLDSADKALYMAKGMGRDCTVMYSPETNTYTPVEKMSNIVLGKD